jgi:hypothetical protein
VTAVTKLERQPSHNTAATLGYPAHRLMENRSALIVEAELTCAAGAERAP